MTAGLYLSLCSSTSSHSSLIPISVAENMLGLPLLSDAIIKRSQRSSQTPSPKFNTLSHPPTPAQALPEEISVEQARETGSQKSSCETTHNHDALLKFREEKNQGIKHLPNKDKTSYHTQTYDHPNSDVWMSVQKHNQLQAGQHVCTNAKLPNHSRN